MKITAADGRSGHDAGEAAVNGERFARHEAGFGPSVGEIKGFDADFGVEIASALLVTELELITGAADVSAAPGDIVAAASGDGSARRQRIADVLWGIGDGDESDL